MEIFEVVIPTLPPSVNALYRIGKHGKIYKTWEAKEWAKGAALIIGAANQGREWDGWLEVWVDVYMKNPKRRDVDNFAKLTLDALSSKLGFDDRYIECLHICTITSEEEKLVVRLRKKEIEQ